MKFLIDWYHKTFGEPVWTEDFDGTIRKARLKKLSDDVVIVTGIYGWKKAYMDGTFPEKCYMSKWWRR